MKQSQFAKLAISLIVVLLVAFSLGISITPNPASAQAIQTPTKTPTSGIALNAPVTGSAACTPNNPPSKVVDGNWRAGSGSYWCSTTTYPWVQIDLRSNYYISKITIVHAGGGGMSPNLNTQGYNVAYSLDNITWKSMVSVAGNVNNTNTFNSNPPGYLGRYIKLNIIIPTQPNGDNVARIFEVLVYGSTQPIATYTPIPPTPGPTETPEGY